MPIAVNAKARGQLAILYDINLPFLIPEEQDLIDTIALDISRWLEHKEDEERIIEMAAHAKFVPIRVIDLGLYRFIIKIQRSTFKYEFLIET